MTLRIPAKVLLHVWSYDFYDMTLSTRKQRRHMINMFSKATIFQKFGNNSEKKKIRLIFLYMFIIEDITKLQSKLQLFTNK